MGQIYRYKDENNNIIYVGLVYGNALDDIHRRIAQHKQDKWTENFKGTIGNIGYTRTIYSSDSGRNRCFRDTLHKQILICRTYV